MRPNLPRKPGLRKAMKFNKRRVKKINKALYKYWLMHPEQYSDPSYIAVMDDNTGKPYILHLKEPVKFKTTLEMECADGKIERTEMHDIIFKCAPYDSPLLDILKVHYLANLEFTPQKGE